MAKQIKAIKCPQCGSTQNAKIGDEHYHCNNCKTEYFLDNDDINVNVNHNYQPVHSQPAPSQQNIKTVLSICAIVLLVFLGGLGMCSRMVRSVTRGMSNNAGSVVTTRLPGSNSTAEVFAYEEKGRLVAVAVYYRQHSHNAEDDRDGFYAVFYDMDADGKIFKEVRLDEQQRRQRSNEASYRVLSNGRKYLITNGRTVYELNTANSSFTNVTHALFNNLEEFRSGLATIDFADDGEGDGFMLMTNTGKEWSYYPIVAKIYQNDVLSQFSHGFKTLLPGARDSVYYLFTEKSHYYDVPLQLIKVTYKSNNGGPEDRPWLVRWDNDYDIGSHQMKKYLFDTDHYRIVSFSDLTPERLYFEPSIAYHDNRRLIIECKPTASPDALSELQRIDTNTGDILWISSMDVSRRRKIIGYSKGIAIVTYQNEFIMIDNNGKRIKTINLSK